MKIRQVPYFVLTGSIEVFSWGVTWIVKKVGGVGIEKDQQKRNVKLVFLARKSE